MSLAEAVLEEFGPDVKALALVPSFGGVMEVTIDGELVYSKKRMGRHPTIDDIRKLVRQKLAG